MQPRGSPFGSGSTPSGSCLALRNSSARPGMFWIIVSSTVLRRSSTPWGLVYGFSLELDCTIPASMAACGTFRSAASMPK
ncbi:Uncharacterised protein [Mycobacteroides abscessus subsp. abscessus]|nr:Uncharacterised protein [Mycobacteroides abscessus subsp. abscessus]